MIHAKAKKKMEGRMNSVTIGTQSIE